MYVHVCMCTVPGECSLQFVSGFEKRGHFAHVIFERTPVFKWLLVGQILLKLNEIFVHNI